MLAIYSHISSIKKTATLILFFCATTLAQPYYYYSQRNAVGYQLRQVNLSTKNDQPFIGDTLSQGALKWDDGQNWIFLEETDRGNNRVYQAISTSNPQIRHSFPSARSGSTVLGLIYVPQLGRFYSSIDWDGTGAFISSYVYDAKTFSLIDSISPSLQRFADIDVFSKDGLTIYSSTLNTSLHQRFIEGFSLKTLSVASSKRELDIGDPANDKHWRDGRDGCILMSYNFPSGTIHKKYVVYDADDDIVLPTIPFPRSSSAMLSADGAYVIIEDTPASPDTGWSRVSHLPTGKFWIYSARNGKLFQRVALSAGGRFFVFHGFAHQLYYLQSAGSIQSIDLTKLIQISSVVPSSGFASAVSTNLSVFGKNFSAEAVVCWNGNSCATTMVSDSILQATIPGAFLTHPDSAVIEVKSADSVFTSNPVRFVVLSAPIAPR